MRVRLKPLSEQVIVITGATSGIGLSTARMAASRGARLVLAARNEAALKTISQDLAGKRAQVAYVVADVGDRAAVERVAKAAIDRFGGFDTWINNAGVGLYGALADVSLEDHRRLFETDYWGVVHGSLLAAEHLSQRGGAIINVGSLLGEVSAPLHGPAAAAKHAMRAFTASLRMEMIRARAPVSVTLIRPGAVDTPFSENARSYLDGVWPTPEPIYAAPLVAQTILHAAEHPVRQMTVGGATATLALLGRTFPGLAEWAANGLVPRLRNRAPGDKPRPDNLHRPLHDLRERAWRPKVREQSLAVAAQMRPASTATLILAAGAITIGGIILGLRLRRPARDLQD